MGETLKWSYIPMDQVTIKEVGDNKYSQQRHHDISWD